MDGYEKHYLTAAMSKPAPEGLELDEVVFPDVLDEFSAMKIEEVQAGDRIREREELRPVEPETEPVTTALWHISDELSKLRAAVDTLDQKLEK